MILIHALNQVTIIYTIYINSKRIFLIRLLYLYIDEFWTVRVPCNQSTEDSKRALQFAAKVFSRLQIRDIHNVRVIHCPQSYGVAINFYDGLKIVYSGDTRPTERLVKLGQDATILIHEATFDDSKRDEAVSKRHSTVSEAMDIAKRMNACRLILTHFSQRYPTMPPTTIENGNGGAIFAFDFLRISFKDLIWAPHVSSIYLIYCISLSCLVILHIIPPDN